MREKLLEDLLLAGSRYLRPKDKGAYRDYTLEEQNFECACCGKDLKDQKNTNRHCDHSHKTKMVRGVLCATCNLTLGVIERSGYDIEWLQQLISYLSKPDSGIVYPEKITGVRKTKKAEMRALKKDNAWKIPDEIPL